MYIAFQVNSEICEQTFSWLSKYARMTRHMNREHFIFSSSLYISVNCTIDACNNLLNMYCICTVHSSSLVLSNKETY